MSNKSLSSRQAARDKPLRDGSVGRSFICKSCIAKRSLLPISTWTNRPPRELASIAIMICLQAMLWHPVIIPSGIDKLIGVVRYCLNADKQGHRRPVEIINGQSASD